MARPIDRKFGEIPEHHKTGPVTLRNYNFRAEWHASIQNAKRKGEHPIIRIGSPEFAGWFEYFEQHLRGFPWPMKQLLAGRINAMTVPELRPEWFDPSFEPSVGYRVQLPRDPEAGVDPQMAARFASLIQRLGTAKQQATQRSKFRRYSEDELRSRYSSQQSGAAE